MELYSRYMYMLLLLQYIWSRNAFTQKQVTPPHPQKKDGIVQ